MKEPVAVSHAGFRTSHIGRRLGFQAFRLDNVLLVETRQIYPQPWAAGGGAWGGSWRN